MCENPLSISNRALDVGGVAVEDGVASLGESFFYRVFISARNFVQHHKDWNTISKVHYDAPFCLFLPIHRPELQAATEILWSSQFGESGSSSNKKKVEYQRNRRKHILLRNIFLLVGGWPLPLLVSPPLLKKHMWSRKKVSYYPNVAFSVTWRFGLKCRTIKTFVQENGVCVCVFLLF
jgi:hypothetical protein